MQATSDALTSVWEILKYLAIALGGGALVELIRTFRNKGKDRATVNKIEADAAHTSAASDSSTLTVSDKLLRQWMKDASEAAIEIAKLRKDLATAEICIEDMSELLLKAIKIMRQFSVVDSDEFAKFETDIKSVLRVVAPHRQID